MFNTIILRFTLCYFLLKLFSLLVLVTEVLSVSFFIYDVSSLNLFTLIYAELLVLRFSRSFTISVI